MFNKTDIFIKKAQKVHGDRYDYSKTIYVKANEKVIIICLEHGEFLQNPDKHLQKIDCLQCSINRRKQNCSSTTKEFIEKAKLIHGDRYNYSLVNYKSAKEKVIIICKMHGEFLQTPDKHLQGGCQKFANIRIGNSRRLTQKDFITRSNKIHNFKYNYSLVNYINNSTKIIIICPIHDQFLQIPGKHLSGKGCRECGKTKNKQNGIGWRKQPFIKSCKNNEATIYLIKCWSDDEEFYKVGITGRTMEERFGTKSEMPYNFEIINKMMGDPEYIYDLERIIHKENKSFKYKPSIKFGGYTECFNTSLPINNL